MNKSQQIDFESATYEEFKAYFIDDLLIDKRPELSSIIRAHLLIELVLGSLIKKANDKFKSDNFKPKLERVKKLGIFPSEFYYDFAKKLNDIRNDYAHNNTYKLKIEDLESFKFNWTENQNQIYEIESKKSLELAVNTTMLFLVATFYKFLSSE